MPGLLTEITELTTALGTLADDLPGALATKPAALRHVPAATWERLVAAHDQGGHDASFSTAFANGAALLGAADGLRGQRPRLVEWKGPHRPPGDDIIPADLRIDHVFLVSCKYLSKVLLNAGAARLFDRLLVGEERSADNWFAVTAPAQYRAFYLATRAVLGLPGFPLDSRALTVDQQHRLRRALADRSLPAELRPRWQDLAAAVAHASALRWEATLTTARARLRLLWRLLRISNATYYVLGVDRTSFLRFRVASAWDWYQRYDLRCLSVAAQPAGQPQVQWTAVVAERATGTERSIVGHVEIRWSHGRFVGAPEAKVYLDTPHADVPGYEPLDEPARKPAGDGRGEPSYAPGASASAADTTGAVRSDASSSAATGGDHR